MACCPIRLDRYSPTSSAMNDNRKDSTLISIKGADEIAPMPGLQMQTTEGHLGGYILDGAAPGTWCPVIWDWAINELRVKSVLDVGCGLGYAARYFQRHGCSVQGVDGSPTAIRDSVIADHVERHDFCHGPNIPAGGFDLVWSAEFVEHVEEQYADNFLFSFRSAQSYVMLTYAAPGQGGYHHVNERPEDYWIDKLQQIGFNLDEHLTAASRELAGDHPVVGKHFRARGLVFIKDQDRGS